MKSEKSIENQWLLQNDVFFSLFGLKAVSKICWRKELKWIAEFAQEKMPKWRKDPSEKQSLSEEQSLSKKTNLSEKQILSKEWSPSISLNE